MKSPSQRSRTMSGTEVQRICAMLPLAFRAGLSCDTPEEAGEGKGSSQKQGVLWSPPPVVGTRATRQGRGGDTQNAPSRHRAAHGGQPTSRGANCRGWGWLPILGRGQFSNGGEEENSPCMECHTATDCFGCGWRGDGCPHGAGGRRRRDGATKGSIMVSWRHGAHLKRSVAPSLSTCSQEVMSQTST